MSDDVRRPADVAGRPTAATSTPPIDVDVDAETSCVAIRRADASAGRAPAGAGGDRRRRQPRWRSASSRVARAAVRARRRLVLLAARPARRPGRAGARSRSSGLGREGGRRRARRPGRDRLVARVPGLGRRSPAPDRSRPAPTSSHEHLGVRAARRPRCEQRPPARRRTSRWLLPPGLTLDQIADRVGAAPGHDRDAFLQPRQSGACARSSSPRTSTSLEGLTWPDTYFIGEHETDADDPADASCRAFDENADAVGLATRRDGLTPYETVIDRVADPGRGQARRGRAR